MVDNAPHRHMVQFYEQDAYLIAKLAEYLGEGFDRGETGIVIATPEHRQALARALNEQGRNAEVLEHKGRLLLLDARESLSRFMRNDFPDEDLFRREIDALLARSAGPVRAFGEMVALLWAEGKEDAAVRLEDLWERALAGSTARLLCAYPIRGMSGAASLRPFRDICSRHTHVLPSESFSSPERTEDERRRMVAELQQRAATMEGQAQEMERLLEDVRQLHHLGFRLSGFSTLEETLLEILRHALSVYRAGQGMLSVPDGDGGGFKVAASIGFPPGFPDRIERLPAAEGARLFCGPTRNPVIIEDIETDPLFREYRESARAGGFRAVHVMPLTTRDGGMIGVLSIHFPSRRRPTEREIKFGEIYSRLASDSIEQARLRVEAAEERARCLSLERELRNQTGVLETLNLCATLLASERDAERIVRAVLDGGKEIAGAVYGAFFHNAGGGQDEVRLPAFSRPRGEAVASFPASIDLRGFGPSLSGWGPARIDDLLLNPLYAKSIKTPSRLGPGGGDPPPMRSYLAVPVVSRSGEVLGGLFFGHPEPGRFGEQAERNLTSLAAQAAVALSNAGLYDALRDQIEQGRSRERQTRHFAAIVASSNDAIVSKDLDSTVLSWNKSAERIFGYTAEEMIGTSITRLIPEKNLDEEPEILRRIQAGETINHYETIRKRKDGTLINISLTVSPIKDENGKIVGASKIARDITDLKAAEGQLRQAQKMEAVGRLAGGVAHDFNNLLTSILGFVDMALAETDPESELAEYLDEVRKAGYRASTLTQQLLAYSRKQILAPRVIDLNECVSDLDKMLRRLLGEDLEFHTRLDPELARIKADPGQMQQVIMNLALNARDAMPGGGLLTVETDNVFLDHAYVANHPDASAGPHVRLTVGDTGTGMPPEILAHIFEPFFTTKEVGKGTGLGLSSVYGIVKQSGGSIAVESHVASETRSRSGTVFRIHFPAVDRKGHGIRQESGIAHDTGPHRGETILLAEDEAAVRKFLVAALKSNGYRVVEARNGAEALETGKELGRIDLIVTDVVMPGLGGAKLAAGLKSLHPGAKILYISGYTRDMQSLRGLGESADFLQKPFSQADLLSKVREVLGSPSLRS